MKTYKFAILNWKSDNKFWFYKRFPSAYYADCWAMRVSYKKKDSPYLVAFIAGCED